MDWIYNIVFGIAIGGTLICLIRENRAWKRQKIKDLSATPEKKAEDQLYRTLIKKG
ncbi:MAG: hypothetical protein KDK71_04705 [Chlamydiia bacterium]|nr:hypothetical protein [Chlamydiia bacterium]